MGDWLAMPACGLRDDRGSSPFGTALALPVVLTLLLALVQVALIFHVHSAVDGAASDGARSIVVTGDTTAAQQRTETLLSSLLGSLAARFTVSASIDGDYAVLEIAGHYPLLAPGIPLLDVSIASERRMLIPGPTP